jgi:hypothetical protein
MAEDDLARKVAETGTRPGNRRGWLDAAVARRREDFGDRLAELASDHPDATIRELADLADPAPRVTPAAVSPEEVTGLARRRLAEREEKRRGGTACPDCDEMGVVMDDDGVAQPCPKCAA